MLGTIAAAFAVTACDAVLLERSKGYFTGGFLSVDHLEGPAQAAGFLLLSVVIDAALIGGIVAAATWALTRLRLHARAAMLSGLFLGAGALMLADVFTYELLQYLGDAFDLGLMFDLTGGSVSEMLAVASAHLLRPAGLVVAAAGAASATVAAVHRRSQSRPSITPSFGTLRIPAAFTVAGLLLLVAATAVSDVLENGLLRKPAGRVFSVVANRLTDVDRDGYGIVGRMSDPDLFNGAVYPYAVDIPGNGLDEDGVGGDLPTAQTEAPGVPYKPEWRQRPDLVVFMLESVRADVVGSVHNGLAVTPSIDAIRDRGVSALAFSHNGYTVQSRYHFFSGAFVPFHGQDTLIDDFRANGYRVGYFSGQDESFGGAAYDIGFGRVEDGHDARSDRGRRYSTATTPGSLAIPFTIVEERVREFLTSRGAGDKPVFLYVNFHDAHFPYTHSQIKPLISSSSVSRDRIRPSEQRALWDTYVNTVANVDRAVGRVIEAVRAARGKAPAVIVTSDHGESLFDDGFLGHGYAINDVQSRVPLVAAGLPLRLIEPVGQVDLRGAIGTALREPPSESSPTVTSNADRTLFQYLGELSRPRAIASMRAGRRFIYDFRGGRARLAEGSWVRPSELPPAGQEEFLRLIRQWERLNLERAGQRRSDSSILGQQTQGPGIATGVAQRDGLD